MSSTYFDFHFHPMFKKNVVKFENSYPTEREDDDLSGLVNLNNDIANAIDKSSLHIIGSQSSIDQVNALMHPDPGVDNGFLGVANITSIEYGFTDVRGLAKDILKLNLASPLDVRYFDNVRKGAISYYQLFIKELSLYRKLNKDGVIKLLSRSNPTQDLDNPSPLPTLALSIEGGHNLLRTKANLSWEATNLDTPQTDTLNIDYVYTDFQDSKGILLSSADSLKQLHAAMWKDGLDLFYLTLTHLSYISEMPLATHAFGMKLLSEPMFYPFGSGLTDEGKAVIDAAYNMHADGNPTPVLIDIKHMSLKSRVDFYNYRKEKGYDLPIVASHMAVTGYSIKDWTSALAVTNFGYATGSAKNPSVYEVNILPKVMAFEDNGDPLRTCSYKLNPWAINFFDEDIREVLQSGGLIGVILDARVLGEKATFTRQEDYDSAQYLSNEEYDFIVNQGSPGIADASAKPGAAVPGAMERFELSGNYNTDEDRNPDRGMICLALNILHIIAVGFRVGVEKPWTQIAIGSDYDGLIEPLELLEDCTAISLIEDKLLRFLPLVESSYLFHNPTDDGNGVLPGGDDGKTDLVELKKWISGFMFGNGKDFLQRWYTGKL